MKFGIGQSIRRLEDVRLVSGAGSYTDDVVLPRMAYAYVVRSPHAHARITGVDVSGPLAAPGVIGVVTAEDVLQSGWGTMPLDAPLKNADGSPVTATPKTLLPADKVRYVGEAVALVVAETPAQAKDAAEHTRVDYDPLPAAGTLEAAAAGKGRQIWDQAPGNLAVDWAVGDENTCADAFAKAAHVATVNVVQNRITAATIEPRAAIGEYDPQAESYALHTNTQGVYGVRHVIAGAILKVPEDKVRVLTGDVGGGFGLKAEVYVEQPLMLLAAKKFGRPVKWTAERGESFLADTHARDARTTGEMALDKDGTILAVRVSGIASIGAYVSQVGPGVPTAFGLTILGGLYRLPAAHVRVKCYFTNQAPIAPYRGAGRPEAAYLMDRLLERASQVSGIDRVELRRRNLMSAPDFPHTNFAGVTYDSGDGPCNLDAALTRADITGFAKRRAASETRGRMRGLGIAYYLEIAGGPPIPERSSIRFTDNGAVEVFASAQSSGQGHETTFAQLVVEQLGVPFDSILVRQGDTDYPASGFGSVGSRSLQTSGSAIENASVEVVKKGKQAAAQVLQADGAAVNFAVSDEGVGRFTVVGTDRGISTVDLAVTLKREKIPGFEIGLDSEVRYAPKSTFPNGCHICEVEIDPETGALDVARYTVVDDLGRVINPLVVEGQVQGGVAQGLGQAMMEHCVYDPESGQLLTASFMDYGMPRADNVPDVDFSYNEIPCTTNPLGSKGAGEAGTVGAPPAFVDAVCDALRVAHIDMPVTPEKVWRAARGTRVA